MMEKLILATKNKGKIIELRDLLKGLPIELISLLDFDFPDTPETGATFAENAVIKAQAVFNQTGIPCIADDSGLEIDALGGKPGVMSARFAGEHGDDSANNLKVLELMEGIPVAKRTARFKCAIAMVGLTDEPFITYGTCEGFITNAPEGNNGFGYDPLFWVHDFEKTMAELSLEEKNLISHRAIAFKKVSAELTKLLLWR